MGVFEDVGVIVDREVVHGNEVNTYEVAIKLIQVSSHTRGDIEHPTYKYPVEINSFCHVLKDVCD